MKPQIIRRQTMRLAFLLAMVSSAFGSTWYVNGVSGSDNNACSSPMQACKTIGVVLALRAAPGDSIDLAPATYSENLTIGYSVTIIGSGQQTTVIDGGSVNTVITISNAQAEVTLGKLTIRNGAATNGLGGGGIFNNGATLTINNSTIRRNRAESSNPSGGGIYTAGGTLIINNGTIRENSALFSGGGIFNNGGIVTINNTTVSGNNADPDGGGSGGGISSTGTLRIRNSIIHANGAQDAAGIYSNGTLVISHSTISGNSAFDGPGAIFSVGKLTIGTSTISGNTANNGSGGIIGDSVTIFDSTINNNSNASTGGAISASHLFIWNSTVANNRAEVAGGISADDATISNCTISGNVALLDVGKPGGISVNSGVIRNSILANSGQQGNCGLGVGFQSKGYNISDDDTCNLNGPGDMNNTSSQLGPLQNNGGPTKTMAIAPGSPAVDAGNPQGCFNGKGQLLKTDQRGKPRPDPGDVGVGCDIGAFERQDN